MKLRSINLIIVAVFSLQGISFSQDVPYVPTPYEVVDEMLAVAKVNQNDVVYDLGCGDGRIVITAAKKFGARGVGIDSNPQRIEESKANAEQNNVSNLVEFKQQDLFKTDLREATVVTLYLLTHVNIKLRPLLFEQLKPGTRIVSHAFDMGEWEPEETREVDGRTIYFWTIPENISGKWETDKMEANGDRVVIDLKQQFQKVNGTVQIGDKSYNITEAQVNGNNIELTFNDGTGDMVFSGKVTDNQLQGNINGANGTNKSLRVERAANTERSLDSGL